MTLQGAIQELYEMREDTSLPVYYALILADVINTLRTDLQEVRHGRWIIEYGDGHKVTSLVGGNCSRCGFFAPATRYCPNCGAKMDGDTE